MLHLVLIVIHAAAGVAAFGAGLIKLRPERMQDEPAVMRIYLGALWLMALILIPTVALHWGDLSTTGQIVFTGLTILALYTGWRGWRAYQKIRDQEGLWKAGYIDDVGFTLITLFDGFVIVAAIDLGAPVWLVILAGALGVVGGHFVVNRAKEQVTAHV